MAKGRISARRFGDATRVAFFILLVGGTTLSASEVGGKSYLNDVNSRESRRFRENLLESFFLRSMRIEFQKNKILEKFQPDELPMFLEDEELEEKEKMFAENDQMENNQEIDDQEMIDFLQRGESPEEEQNFDIYHQSPEAIDPVISEESVHEEIDDLVTDSWIDYFRPMWRFCKDNYRSFMKEFKEQKNQLRAKWRYLQNDGEEDEDYARLEDHERDEEEFEKVDVERKLVFLDEGRFLLSHECRKFVFLCKRLCTSRA